MKCPVCNHDDTKVVDTRITSDSLGVRRRRVCSECEYRFSTIEGIEILDLAVVKRDGRKSSYLREKLEGGLRRSLEKRPCTPEQFKSLVGAIERDIQKLKRDEVQAEEIGEIVMDHLKRFDMVAYIRFASVYRSFADVQSFHEEVEKLMARETIAGSKRSKKTG